MPTQLYGQETDIPTLRVLTAGVIPSNSADLLQSELAIQILDHFKKAPFDYVIFDTPPLLLTADAQVVASRVQATILVIDVSKTPRRVLLQAKRVLNKMCPVLQGVVINKSPWSEYSGTREYLSEIQPPKSSIAMTENHNTPPVNGSIVRDITVITPQKQKAGGEKS
jgi:Mrp family chromosome partitioning ATPase